MPPTNAFTNADVYVFHAALVGFRGVSCKLAVPTDRTLEDVHRLLQQAFGWDDDHLYAFWPSGRFWDREPGSGFGRPGFCRESGDRSARVKLGRLGLEVGQSVAYVFDFGDEWRVRLKLVEVRVADGVPLPSVFDQRGEVPPQYSWEDEDLEDVA
jgi:hypothetical protein